MSGPDYVGCPADRNALIEAEIDRVMTQYRESPNLLGILRADLNQIFEALQVACSVPDFFDINTAIGDQLTILGRRLGWPRDHCFCTTHPVFGFDCEGESSFYQISGFCVEGARWADCIDFGTGTFTIDDDETYRKFLKVRRYQFLALYDIDSLNECARILFGPQALVLDSGNRKVVIAPGRTLTTYEASLLPLYRRVLPVAFGIDVYFHFRSLHPFGFGDGWGGFCDQGTINEIFVTENEELFVTNTNKFLITGSRMLNSEWLCPVKIEDCMNTSIYGPNGIHPLPDPVTMTYSSATYHGSNDLLIFNSVELSSEHEYREIFLVIAGSCDGIEIPISNVRIGAIECDLTNGVISQRGARSNFVIFARANIANSEVQDIVIVPTAIIHEIAFVAMRTANRTALNTSPVQVVSNDSASNVSSFSLLGIAYESDKDYCLSAIIVNSNSVTIDAGDENTLLNEATINSIRIAFFYGEASSVVCSLAPARPASGAAFNIRG